MIEVLKSKLHCVRVTEANLNYMGSITIDEDLMDAANMIAGEKVHIVDNNNGERFETYIIKGERGSGCICLNGAAARKVQVGDIVIIMSYAMMDISDGLSSELLHICSQSDTGCRVYEERIPIDYQTAVMAEELNMNVTTCALNGGEDYELLFTVPLTDHEKVSTMKGVKVIGHITKPELGCALVTRDGQEFELKAQGWNPLKEK